MATYYSNVFTGLGATTASTKSGTSVTQMPSVQTSHARTRTSVAHLRIDADEDFVQGADVAHMFLLKPTDRLVRLQYTSDDLGGTALVDVGVYTVISANGSLTFAADDVDLFATAFDVSGQVTAWTDLMHESTTVGYNYIGKPMWEIVNLGGGGTFTAQSPNLFSISVAPKTNSSTADNVNIILMATYIAGD